MICQNCQKKIKDNAKFCNFCGEKTVKELEIASSNKRLINFVLDEVIFIALFAYPSAYIIGVILALLGLYDAKLFDNESVINILTYFLMFIYFFGFESLFGRTPAKFITKTKVVTESGGKPDSNQMFKRSLTRFIPFEIFSFSGKNPVGWHDKWSKTRVVNS